MHEHVMVSASGLYDSYPDLLGPDREDRAVKALVDAREGGVDPALESEDLAPDEVVVVGPG